MEKVIGAHFLQLHLLGDDESPMSGYVWCTTCDPTGNELVAEANVTELSMDGIETFVLYLNEEADKHAETPVA